MEHKAKHNRFDKKMNAHELNRIVEMVLDAAIKVHRTVGPGLPESAYAFCLKKELTRRGLKVQMEVPLHLMYEGEDAGKVYMLDMLIDDTVIIEIKAIENLQPLHQAQLLTYMRLQKAPLGYLINFNVPLLKMGFRRMVLNFPDAATKQGK
jgi:GxxExxY protein